MFLLDFGNSDRYINFFLMNQYTMVSKLGEGAFSVVYKVKRKEDGL